MVPRAGFEPAFPDLKDRCPRPFRRTWHWWSGRRELNSRPLLGGQRLYRLSHARVADGAGVEPARPKGLDALAPRCLTARPTIRTCGFPWRALGVNRTPDPPFRRRPLSSAELRGQVARHPILRNGTSGRGGGANATPQSLYGSNSPGPAIATANGRSVWRTLMVPSCSRSTSGSRR